MTYFATASPALSMSVMVLTPLYAALMSSTFTSSGGIAVLATLGSWVRNVLNLTRRRLSDAPPGWRQASLLLKRNKYAEPLAPAIGRDCSSGRNKAIGSRRAQD